jgi:hypothetical protein
LDGHLRRKRSLIPPQEAGALIVTAGCSVSVQLSASQAAGSAPQFTVYKKGRAAQAVP